MDLPLSEEIRTAQGHYDFFCGAYRVNWGLAIHSALSPKTWKYMDDGYRAMNALITAVSELGEVDSVLSVGCGTGHADRFLAETHAKDVIGVDISRGQLDYANANKPDDVYYVQGSMTALPVLGESVDAVWLQQAFVHCKDKDVAVKEFGRVLKKGGKVIIEDPVVFCGEDFGAMQCYERLVPGSHIISLEEQKALFEAGGFDHFAERDISEHFEATYKSLPVSGLHVQNVIEVIESRQIGSFISVYRKPL